MPKKVALSSKFLQAEIEITGMHCQSCELLIERKLRQVPGIVDVSVDARSGIATLTADAMNPPNSNNIGKTIIGAGYHLATKEHPGEREHPHQKWIEIGAALIVIFAIAKLLKALDLVTLAPSTSGALTTGGTFLIGFVAGTSSCLAITGGLLLSVAAKYNETRSTETAWQKLQPLLAFNIGRIVAYTILGGLVGLLGSALTLGTQFTGLMNIAIGGIMLWIALSILGLLPKGSCPIRPPKWIGKRITALTESNSPLAPTALGALTFFLPCGFTQSLQLAALATGSFLQGALIMGTFALGTLPSLIGLSAVSATAKGTMSRVFLRFAGTVVLVLAIFNTNSGLILLGIDLPHSIASATGNKPETGAVANVREGTQEISMRVTSSGYVPAQLTVRAGIPVKWTIDGSGAAGCTSVLVIPSLDIVRPLERGLNIVEFTPTSKGPLAFSCSMGMVRGSINVI